MFPINRDNKIVLFAWNMVQFIMYAIPIGLKFLIISNFDIYF